jgi:hypothetical protein
MGTQPGPKSLGSLTSCGGGGGAAKAISNRNSNYGITGNPYNGTNYVQAEATFNPDGTLNPPPNFNLAC